jgi:hypothetical protein
VTCFTSEANFFDDLRGRKVRCGSLATERLSARVRCCSKPAELESTREVSTDAYTGYGAPCSRHTRSHLGELYHAQGVIVL